MKDLNEIAKDLREEHVAGVVGPMDRAAASLESPLEAAMLWALVLEADEPHMAWARDVWAQHLNPSLFPGIDRQPRLVSLINIETSGGYFEYDVVPQLTVETGGRRYRLDFAVLARCPNHAWTPGDPMDQRYHRATYALECDGHDFHDRTKEQAERDRVRDRDLQSVGWNVARFTGAEVYRDARAAAKRALRFGEDLLGVAGKGK